MWQKTFPEIEGFYWVKALWNQMEPEVVRVSEVIREGEKPYWLYETTRGTEGVVQVRGKSLWLGPIEPK